MGSKLDVEYSIAARLIARLSGPALRAARMMTEADLMPERLETQTTPPTRKQLMKGVDNLMNKMRELAPQKESYRGELMNEFFNLDKHKRRAGERLTDWSIRWHEATDQLEKNGINLLSNKSLAA